MITLFRILEIYKIPTNMLRLVRHGDKELRVLETFRLNRERFDVYQSFQIPKKFGDAQNIAVFSPLPNNASLFLGLWSVNGVTKNKDLTDHHRSLIDHFKFPESWKSTLDFYDLQLNPELVDLSERLVIDWGGAPVQWVQHQDKPVLEIRRPHSISEFVSYSSVKLDYHDLRQLILNEGSNLTWKNALSTVNGIYLIRDKSSGKLYVGSAYNEQGIYGRWRQYALNGHGGNKLLDGLNPQNFEFSILEITSYTLSHPEVIQIENKWKERLGTRTFGNLNIN